MSYSFIEQYATGIVVTAATLLATAAYKAYSDYASNEQTDAPAEVTNAPAEVTNAPAEVTNAPAEVTNAPAEGSSRCTSTKWSSRCTNSSFLV
ncbi:MAG: hypothetical protein EBY16_08485 [Gammaproteobacteria bacterium]|nr:hypothetical protein [Gammaproteobacteria bacterium]